MSLPLLLACAVCGASERALPANGSEVAFEGRKRATLDVRAAAFATTTGPDVRVTELRAEAGAAAAVDPRLLVSVTLPVLRRAITTDVRALPDRSARRDETILGDAEVHATYSAYKTIGRHATLDAGLKAPTAPLDHDSAGRLLTPDLQPGCSSVVPSLGATYLVSGALVSTWLTASLLMPVSVRDAAHAGDSARASFTLQLQPTQAFATRLGVFARFDGTGELDGTTVARSGGGAVHIAPEIVLSPLRDLVLTFGAAFPAIQAMRAYRSSSPVVLASLGLDF
jgi:hypothetical protein